MGLNIQAGAAWGGGGGVCSGIVSSRIVHICSAGFEWEGLLCATLTAVVTPQASILVLDNPDASGVHNAVHVRLQAASKPAVQLQCTARRTLAADAALANRVAGASRAAIVASGERAAGRATVLRVGAHQMRVFVMNLRGG